MFEYGGESFPNINHDCACLISILLPNVNVNCEKISELREDLCMPVVSSLRYLSLKKVIEDDIKNYDDIPTVLVRDINRMKSFNGSYSSYYDGRYGGMGDSDHRLSIFYDGENWNFKSFIHFKDLCYCPYCRDPDDPLEITISEGQNVPVQAPAGSQIQKIITDMLGNSWPLNFDMKLKVGEEQEDGTCTLVFYAVGNGRTTVTPFSKIVRSRDGVRMIHVPTGAGILDVFLPSSGT